MKDYKNSLGMTAALKQYVINHLKDGFAYRWDEDIIFAKIDNDDELRISEKNWCFENYHEIEIERMLGTPLPEFDPNKI